MRHKIFAAAATLALLFGLVAPAYASPDDDDYVSTGDITILGWNNYSNRCTQRWYISGEGNQPYAVCMRLYYTDHGNTVTLKKILVYMTNVRPQEHSDGYYFDVMYVRCNRNDGSSDAFFPTSNKVLITDDAQDFNINPNNLDCGEGNVRFGGNGIINQRSAFDLNDEFGSSPNAIPVD